MWGKAILVFVWLKLYLFLSLFLKDNVARHKILGLTVNFC